MHNRLICTAIFFGLFILGCDLSSELVALIRTPTLTPTATLTRTPTLAPTATLTRTPTFASTATLTRMPTPFRTPTASLGGPEVLATAQACAQASPIVPINWRVLFCDNFDFKIYQWNTRDVDNEFHTANFEIVGGKFHWDIRAKRGTSLSRSPGDNSVSDFFLSIEGQRVGGEGGAAYGVFSRYDGANYLVFEIRDDQLARVLFLYQQEWKTWMDWTKVPAIRPNQPNRITVKAEASHFIFYVNDVQVYERDDRTVTRGTAGIFVDLVGGGDTGIFDFTHFELRLP